jgi:L-asparaginase II
VRRILAGAELDEDALRCPADWPFDTLAALAYARRGLDPAPVAHNCSGKHAAMLATCVAQGWPLEDVLDPEHPLQQAVRDELEHLADEVVGHVGTDGCGAPLYAISLRGLALAVSRLVQAPPGTPEGLVVDAVRTFPEWASGTTRDEARLLRAVPGLLAKMGAEAVYVAALADGRAVALAIEDGGDRARPVAMAAALRRLGVDHPVLDALGRPPVLGGGQPVGELRSTW